MLTTMNYAKFRRLTGSRIAKVTTSIIAVLLALGLNATAQANIVTNSDFEATPFTTGWAVTGTPPAILASGLGGSNQAARFGDTVVSGTLNQTLTGSGSNWEFTADFITSTTSIRSLQLYIDHALVTARINFYVGSSGRVFVFNQGVGFTSLFGGASVVNFSSIDGSNAFTTELEHSLKIVGNDYGTAGASYDVILTDNNGTVNTETGLTFWQGTAPTTAAGDELVRTSLVANNANDGFWVWDNVQISPVPEPGTLSLLVIGSLLAVTRKSR